MPEIYFREMVPVDARCDGDDGVSLDAGFALLRCDDEYVFAVGARQGVVDHGDEARRGSGAADAVQQCGNGRRVGHSLSGEATCSRPKGQEQGNTIQKFLHNIDLLLFVGRRGVTKRVAARIIRASVSRSAYLYL